MSMAPLVAIIGQPNVGKSTLFNRILGSRTAIVDNLPGVTRDRNYADSTYQSRPFRLVDTGGLDPAAGEGMRSLIRRQVQIAIEEADVLIVVVDGRAGLTPMDEDILALLRGVTKPIYIAVNKLDSPASNPLLADFYRLGQDTLYPVSAEHGTGVDDLLDAAIPAPRGLEPMECADPYPRIAIVGRPNVGKSTLINTLFGMERMIVSELPGTTRDCIDTVVSYKGQSYLFTDTAGMRRRGRIDRGIEWYSVARALRAMGRSDIAVLILDAVEGITEQDTKIAGLIMKQGRGCIVLVNKWDLREGEPDARERYTNDLHRRFAFLTWAPVLFGSALKPNVGGKLFPLVDRVMRTFSQRIPTGQLNKFLQTLLAQHPLPVRKGKPTKVVKSVYATQVTTRPPVFALFVGRPEDVGRTYIRFLENRLREQYDFLGTSIRILLRAK
ncbi:MAG: ribosome biogenesis GTPase Der [Nitrospirales bacterium]